MNEALNGLNEVVYATVKKSDRDIYRKILPNAISYKIQSDKNVRIMGNRNAEKLYNNLLKTDKEFASHYGNMSYKDFNGMLGYANKLLIENKKMLSQTYMSPFFKEMAAKGYDAVVYTQDRFAKLPIILINTTNRYRIV